MTLSEALGKTSLGPTMETLLWALKVRPMLNYFREFQCKDPRDKVYAALPLALPESHLAITPDYSLSIAEVYIKVVESFIKHEKCLSILADRSGTDPEMPSWVADFRCTTDSYSLCTRLDNNSCSIYRAGGKRLPEASVGTEHFPLTKIDPGVAQALQQQESQFPVRNVLNVNGVVLDKVKILGPSVVNSKLVRRLEWEALLAELPKQYSPTNEATSDSYQRTLTADISDSMSWLGYHSSATWSQRISTALEWMESDFRAWLFQADKYPQSFSILQWWSDVPGPRRKHTAWARGDDPLKDFFDRPEPPEEKDTILHLDDADDECALGRTGEGDGVRSWKTLIHEATKNRVFCITEKGYMGLVPYQTKEGDQIVVLFGGNTPFVLREQEYNISGPLRGQLHWQLIRESYIHGFMDGEALIRLNEDGSEVRTEKFVLI